MKDISSLSLEALKVANVIVKLYNKMGTVYRIVNLVERIFGDVFNVNFFVNLLKFKREVVCLRIRDEN